MSATDCKHPPRRLYTGWANNAEMIECMWVACCDCGEVLTLDAWPKRTARLRREALANSGRKIARLETK